MNSTKVFIWTLKIFDLDLSLDIISQSKETISIKIKGIPLQYANALRRICLNGVAIYAIDTVDTIINSSVMADEGIAHRLGMIPLKTEFSAVQYRSTKRVGRYHGMYTTKFSDSTRFSTVVLK